VDENSLCTIQIGLDTGAYVVTNQQKSRTGDTQQYDGHQGDNEQGIFLFYIHRPDPAACAVADDNAGTAGRTARLAGLTVIGDAALAFFMLV
jgi:hypothetical protein